MATLSRIEGKPGSATVSIPAETIPTAQHSFAVDVVRVMLFRGNPEIHLAQIDMFAPDQPSRVVRVRYERQMFIERVQNNAAFLTRLKARLADNMPDWRSGQGADWFARAKPSTVPAVVVDAEFEFCSHVGDRGAIVFLATGTTPLAIAIQKGSNDVWFDAPLECSMPLTVQADLLESWATVAKEMTP